MLVLDGNPPNPPQTIRPAAEPPPHPIRVTTIQTRSPSLERIVILVSSTPIAYVALMPPMTPIPPMETSGSNHDIGLRLQKKLLPFYVRATSVARGYVKMGISNQLWGSQYNPHIYFICCHVVCWILIWSTVNFMPSWMRLTIGRTTHRVWTGCSGSALKVKTRNHVSAYLWPPYVCTKKSSNNCKINMKLLNTI